MKKKQAYCLIDMINNLL